ncbi:MAG TPA: alanine dehydrogenase, partial [Chitinophagales bacterium]|nr:alanine dehydrogenase [Chitinophagales bacterium]
MTKKTVFALLREEKSPPDNRVAFSPQQCLWLKNKYSDLEIIVQPCKNRCYKDSEYAKEGLLIQEDLSQADWLIGIKEVPSEKLIEGKRYMLFSHTIKKQPHNQKLLQTVIEKNVTLVDYECLVWETGERVLGFGHYAGVVGMHNGFKTYGCRYKIFDL